MTYGSERPKKQMSVRMAQTRKTAKYLWLPNPTQLAIHGQWWSNRRMHLWAQKWVTNVT
jgi:hypothetical protein